MKSSDNLMAWRVYCAAHETGNLTRAAIELDIDVAAASRMLDNLEKSLGAKLLYRNRRPFIATAEGDEVYDQVRKLLDDHEKILKRFIGAQGSPPLPPPHRIIRLSAAQGYGHGWLMPRLLEYMRLFPGVTFDTLTERNLRDLAEDRIDVLLSVHRFVRQGFVIKPYAYLPCIAFASPEYVRQYGMPEQPEDLGKHVGLIRSGTNFPTSNDLITDGKSLKNLRWGKEIKAENSIVLKRLAIQGVGIVFDLPIGFFVEELEQKLLVPVIGRWRRTPFPCAVVATERTYRSDKEIRQFVDWMVLEEGKASNGRTLEALKHMNKTVEEVFSDAQEFYDPMGAFFRKKSAKQMRIS